MTKSRSATGHAEHGGRAAGGGRGAHRVRIKVRDRLYAESLALALRAAGFNCSLVEPSAAGFARTPAHEFALLVLECGERGRSAERTIGACLRAFPGSRVLLLSPSSSADEEADLLSLGVHGVFPGSGSLEDLARAIEAVGRGEIWAGRTSTSRLIERLSRSRNGARQPQEGEEHLSEREKEILALVGTGMKNSLIGEKLNISERTVKVHLSNIFRKIGAKNRLQAVLHAQEHHLACAPLPPGRSS